MNYFNGKDGKMKVIGVALVAGMLGLAVHSAFAELSTTATGVTTVGATSNTSAISTTISTISTAAATTSTEVPVVLTTPSTSVAPVTVIPDIVSVETEKVVPAVNVAAPVTPAVNTTTVVPAPATKVNTGSLSETKEKEKTTTSQSSVAPIHKQAKSKVTLEDKDRGDKVSGNTKVSVKIEEKENVAAVEVNLTRKDGGESLYIGKVLVDPVDTQGVVSWDSANTPDGSYELTTLITKQDGEVVQGDSVAVVVKNEEEKWVKTKDTTSLGNSSVREVSRQFVAEKFVEDIKSTHVVKEEQIKKEMTNTLKTFSEEKEKKEVAKDIVSETVPSKTNAKDDAREFSVQPQKLSTDFEKVVNEKAQELKEAVKKGDDEKKKEIVTEIVNAAQVSPAGTTVADNVSQAGIAQDALVKNIEEGVAKLEQVAIEQQSGIVDVKNFAVEAVAVAEVAAKPDGTKTASKISFKGKALPNSFATLYIFSIPIVVTVKTDNDGNWNYTLDKELENGEHKVFVAITDVKGTVVARSNPLPFVKEAFAITVPQIVPDAGSSPSFIEDNYFYGSITAIVLIVIAIFVLLGIKMKNTPQE